MSKHQIPYPRWRVVVDSVWPFNPWSNRDYRKVGRHEKTMMQRLYDVTPYTAPFLNTLNLPDGYYTIKVTNDKEEE